MDLKQQINLLLKEANTYRSQGLLDEAIEIYTQVCDKIQQQKHLKNKQELMDKIRQKRREIEKELRQIQSVDSQKILSDQVQNLIKDKFSFSDDKDMAELEGVIALAKFGQHERALDEFHKLLTRESLRVEAAKNILRCHITYATADNAVQQYQQWIGSDLFTYDQMEHIRAFLQKLLDTQKVNVVLPHAGRSKKVQKPEAGLKHETGSYPIDITSISIAFETGPLKGRRLDFDVSFQSGDIISFIIPDEQKHLLESLNIGDRLGPILFYSPIAIFSGASVIFAKKKIEFGPRQGHYSLDLKLTSE